MVHGFLSERVEGTLYRFKKSTSCHRAQEVGGIRDSFLQQNESRPIRGAAANPEPAYGNLSGGGVGKVFLKWKDRLVWAAFILLGGENFSISILTSLYKTPQ